MVSDGYNTPLTSVFSFSVNPFILLISSICSYDGCISSIGNSI